MTREFERTKRADDRVYGARAWLDGGSPWLLASVVAVLGVCLADLIALPPWPRPAALALLLGLAVFFAVLHGALWSVLLLLLSKLPAPLRLSIWPVAGLGAGLVLAHALGVFSRLDGRYAQLANRVLVVSCVAGVALGGLIAALQPGRERPAWLIARRSWQRLGAAVLLCTAAVACWIADRRYFPGQYSYAHLALRVVSMWSGMFACVAAAQTLRLPRLPRWAWAVALAGFAACLFAPDAQRLVPLLAVRPWPWLVLEFSQRVTDVDGDGYSAFLGGGDCAPWNSRVHPDARELPDNGIDDNCLLGDARSKSQQLRELAVPKTAAPLDLVLITVDSLRPDHMGGYNPAYGPGQRSTTPNFDRFARSATVFDRAYTPGAWTSVAVPALLRGVYPRRLQWKRWFETTLYALIQKPFAGKLRPGEQPMRMFPMAFDDRHPPISSMLRRRGMYTTAVTDDGHSEMLQSGTGVESGFASFREVDSLPFDRHTDAGTADLAITALRQVPSTTRFFMWVHFFGIHWPDETHAGVRDYGPSQADRYDHEIAFWDRECGRLLDELRSRKHPVAVIVTADHGESLVAGIRQHGLTLEEAVIKVPLAISAPGWPARRVAQAVSSLDLVPTILALSQTPIPDYLDGIDLGRIIRGENVRPRILFSDTWRFDALERLEINYSAAFDGLSKVIIDRMRGGIYELDQRNDYVPAANAGSPAFGSLTRALNDYLEETGGALDLSE